MLSPLASLEPDTGPRVIDMKTYRGRTHAKYVPRRCECGCQRPQVPSVPAFDTALQMWFFP